MLSLQTLKINTSTIRELLHFFWKQKLWWLIPFVLVLVIIGALMVFTQASPVAPFVYAAF